MATQVSSHACVGCSMVLAYCWVCIVSSAEERVREECTTPPIKRELGPFPQARREHRSSR